MASTVPFGKRGEGRQAAPVLISLPDVRGLGADFVCADRASTDRQAAAALELATRQEAAAPAVASDSGSAGQAVGQIETKRRGWGRTGKIFVSLALLLVLLISMRAFFRAPVEPLEPYDLPLVEIDMGSPNSGQTLTADPLDLDADMSIPSFGGGAMADVAKPSSPSGNSLWGSAPDLPGLEPPVTSPDGAASNLEREQRMSLDTAAQGPPQAASDDYRLNAYPRTAHPEDTLEMLRLSGRPNESSTMQPTAPQSPFGERGNEPAYR